MSERLLRRLLILLAALALLVGPAGGAAAEDGSSAGGDNAAVAVNTKDGSSVFRFAFSVKRVMGEVVDNTNAAVAYASCESCQTVAISIQLVLVSGSPDTVTPQNVAIAINDGCTSCETFASAYQYVLGVGDGPVHFTAEGNRMLAELRRRLAQLDPEGMSTDELQAEVDALVGILREAVTEHLVPAGRSGDDGEGAGTEADAERDDGSGTTTGGATTEAEPVETAPSTTTTETEPVETTETQTTETETTETTTTPTTTTPASTTPTTTTETTP